MAPHLLDQVHDLRLLAREIEAVDRLADQHVHFVFEPGEAGARPSLARQQAGQPRIGQIAAQQRIDMGRPIAQPRAAASISERLRVRIFGKATDHRQASPGFIPSGRGVMVAMSGALTPHPPRARHDWAG